MVTVAKAVSEIIKTDELGLEAFRAGILNLSAYAEKIQKRVEAITFKQVKKGTITVALSRTTKGLPTVPLHSQLIVSNIAVKSSLSALTFDKTPEVYRKISILNPFILLLHDLFAVVEGPSEVTIVYSERSNETILNHFATKPKAEYDNLAAITVQIPKKLADTPNVVYSFLSVLAVKRIHVIQIVTTFAETSFIIKKEDMEESLKSLNTFYEKS